MSRPYTDITLARSNKPIKNGEGVVGVGFTGNYSTLDTYVNVNPTILTIQNKYGNRFYNGAMVYVWDGIDGGGASTGGGLNITPIATNAPTNTPTASVTPTSTPMSTATSTPTNTTTPTQTSTPTNTVTSTPTASHIGVTQTPTSSVTPTSSPAPGVTPTSTSTPTSTATPTPSSTSNNIHAEALDWANRVASNGGTVSNSTLNAVSAFCNNIDSAGLRDRFYRLNLICGNGLSSALVPLYKSYSPSANSIGGSSDTNFNLISSNYIETGSSGGLSASGYGTGIDTTITSAMFEDPLNFHFSCYVFGTPYNQYSSSIMGYDGYVNGYRSRVGFSIPPSNANDKLRGYAITDTAGVNYTTNGLICSIMDSGAVTIYGGSSGALVENYASTNSNATPASISMYLLGLRVAGVNGPSYCIASPAGASYYSIGRKLTSAQYTQLFNILTTFQTTLGRNQ